MFSSQKYIVLFIYLVIYFLSPLLIKTLHYLEGKKIVWKRKILGDEPPTIKNCVFMQHILTIFLVFNKLYRIHFVKNVFGAVVWTIKKKKKLSIMF